jgi:hypothetical protein
MRKLKHREVKKKWLKAIKRSKIKPRHFSLKDLVMDHDDTCLKGINKVRWEARSLTSRPVILHSPVLCLLPWWTRTTGFGGGSKKLINSRNLEKQNIIAFCDNSVVLGLFASSRSQVDHIWEVLLSLCQDAWARTSCFLFTLRTLSDFYEPKPQDHSGKTSVREWKPLARECSPNVISGTMALLQEDTGP